MAETQRGVGRYFGVASTVAAIAASDSATGQQTGCGIGTFHITSYTLTNSAEKITSKSGVDGLPVSEVYHGHMEELSLEVEFYGATMSAAQASYILLPSAGSTLTITDAVDTKIAGAWVVQSSTKTGTVDAIGRGSITCARPIAGALTLITS